MSEGADEHFFNSREKNFPERLVGAIVLVEECGGSVESIAKFKDLGASKIGWDDGFRAGVERHDECDGRQSVVNDGRDSQLKNAEGAATKVGLDRGGV